MNENLLIVNREKRRFRDPVPLFVKELYDQSEEDYDDDIYSSEEDFECQYVPRKAPEYQHPTNHLYPKLPQNIPQSKPPPPRQPDCKKQPPQTPLINFLGNGIDFSPAARQFTPKTVPKAQPVMINDINHN